ncbi:MAG TPA: GntR family transcriptional regulator [Aliidongia sp.]|nr:GntR family transcriptional regulator [Aliidongia sp.]
MIRSLDRSLPIALGVQLRGLIEYGVACGELKRGERLPSVRGLAAQLGVAPMTVAQVFKELQIAGVIRSEPGRGSFVAGDVTTDGPYGRFAARVRTLTEEAAVLGIGRSELAAMIEGMPLRPNASSEPRLKLTFVGNYEEATASYVAAIRAELPGADAITGITLDQLAADPRVLAAARSSDLLLTVANRAGDLRRLIGRQPPIQILSFIPSERTRRQLAELDPRTRLGLVSTLPEFLPIMKAGVGRFAPHIPNVGASLLDDSALDKFLAQFDVIVLATGAEAVMDRLPSSARAIEYRHTPDPLDIDRVLKPLLEQLRAQPSHVRAVAS